MEIKIGVIFNVITDIFIIITGTIPNNETPLAEIRNGKSEIKI